MVQEHMDAPWHMGGAEWLGASAVLGRLHSCIHSAHHHIPNIHLS